MRDFVLPFLISAATGVLSGWGVGGGTLLMVCLTLFLGIDHRQAQAINLVVFLPTAAMSLLSHCRNDLVDKKIWGQAGIAGTLAALLFSIFALNVDVSVLRKPFGIFLLVNAVMMLYGARKR